MHVQTVCTRPLLGGGGGGLGTRLSGKVTKWEIGKVGMVGSSITPFERTRFRPHQLGFGDREMGTVTYNKMQSGSWPYPHGSSSSKAVALRYYSSKLAALR